MICKPVISEHVKSSMLTKKVLDTIRLKIADPAIGKTSINFAILLDDIAQVQSILVVNHRWSNL